MSWTAPLARPLMAGMFVAGGWDALRNPSTKVDRADTILPQLSDAVGLSVDSEALVRANGAAMVVAGLTFGAGIAPRISAAVLAGSLIPTTLAGHRFWELPPGPERAGQRIHFLKNAAMLGGLLLAVGEIHFHPVLGVGRRLVGPGSRRRRSLVTP
ncbi:MAG: DoxX family protein [Acidimicrobiia bacterium]|nr:DoxX family protein [Acidimicrobiia bacterium]